ncbi:DegT/DnrJ/EryC1/StrS family aminotransferase [Flavimaricola marinus]|uniref:dTDP-4-amino-4,6-dideoxy-D-glucose transaminase n=1 Tax=Flavimaricola marinus TaxID=1819565 RepID=A0A238LI73_9RHOB|nr:DegT/DnrJ/EryC1/StrS family aminotransferase [Flavimaricola marinus]SMY09312.1 dTDP-4-amino-4,6-dideoxy-D-glucose transaminase [Flavimaricola marinus]
MTYSDYVYVCRPQLPDAEAIAGYIRGIDSRRHYSNRGPLVQQLEERIATSFERPAHAVRSTSSGTSALEVAILAKTGLATPDRPLALIPSFSFAATGLAVERCGYRVHFVDIDPETWALDPVALARHPLLDQAGLIVSVAPYGVLPDMAALEALHAATGVPVVVDAAAAFEAVLDHPDQISQSVPLSLSFHATKTFSTGEGGAVIWDNPAGQDMVQQVSNFGFFLSRECKVAGTNAKMSEYHAAVGLAMLDEFPARRRDYARVSALYAKAAEVCDPGGAMLLPPRVSSAYALFEAQDAAHFDRAEKILLGGKVETRRWYEDGQHTQPHFAAAGSDPLPVTDSLSRKLIGLPMAHDLAAHDVARVVRLLQQAAEPAAGAPDPTHGMATSPA